MTKAYRSQASRPDREREKASSGSGPVKSYKMSPDELEDYRAKNGYKEPADQQLIQRKKGIDIPVNNKARKSEDESLKLKFLTRFSQGNKSISAVEKELGLGSNQLYYRLKKWNLVGITPEKAKALLESPDPPEVLEDQNASLSDYEKLKHELAYTKKLLEESRTGAKSLYESCQEMEVELKKWNKNDNETQELMLEITAERDQRENELLDIKQQLTEMTEDRDNWKQTAQEVKQAIAEIEEERQLLLETIERAAATPQQDNVNNPSHYTQGGIETIDFIRAKLTPEEFEGYCKGNVLKYVARSTLKGGQEDLRKAGKYIEFAVGGANRA